jgi:uncharacterized protein (DUF736 family)
MSRVSSSFTCLTHALGVNEMSKSKATKAAPSIPMNGGDGELETLVSKLEAEFSQRDERDPVNFINESSRGVLVLFPYAPLTMEEGKKYPSMKGHLDTRQAKVKVSAFAAMTDEGREYLSLSIGDKGSERMGGALFRDEEQDEMNGRWTTAPGKENERHGLIAKTVKSEVSDEYQTLFELKCSGARKLSAAGVPFIRVKVYPVRVAANSEASMQGCF